MKSIFQSTTHPFNNWPLIVVISGHFKAELSPCISRIACTMSINPHPCRVQHIDEAGHNARFFLPFPSPFFYSLHFSRCNSLLPNPTETLATQSREKLATDFVAPASSSCCSFSNLGAARMWKYPLFGNDCYVRY